MGTFGDLEDINTNSKDTKIPRYHDTVTGKNTGSNSEHYEERVRRAVRRLGKESATLRLTDLEKGALSDIVYANKKRGVRTTETEIIRIALNYLLDDYEQKAEESILAAILDRLNS